MHQGQAEMAWEELENQGPMARDLAWETPRVALDRSLGSLELLEALSVCGALFQAFWGTLVVSLIESSWLMRPWVLCEL